MLRATSSSASRCDRSVTALIARRPEAELSGPAFVTDDTAQNVKASTDAVGSSAAGTARGGSVGPAANLRGAKRLTSSPPVATTSCRFDIRRAGLRADGCQRRCVKPADVSELGFASGWDAHRTRCRELPERSRLAVRNVILLQTVSRDRPQRAIRPGRFGPRRCWRRARRSLIFVVAWF